MTWSPLVCITLAIAGVASCGDANSPGAGGVRTTPQPLPVYGEPIAGAPLPAWSIPRRVLFLHRSVGFALIRNGAVGMYDVLGQLNAEHGTEIEMWHHGCGTSPYWNRYFDGSDRLVEPNFGPALSEPLYASPEHWKKIFCDGDPQYVAARDSIDNFRVIVFKSGYDNTVSYASERAGQWRQLYRTMRESAFFSDPTRRIIVLGFPPTREGLGVATQADADSSRAFNEWLVEEFIRGRANLFGFPLFDRLAGEDNWLRDEYELVAYPNDAHPNPLGCEIVGRELMTYIHQIARLGEQPEQLEMNPHSVPAE